MRLEVDPSLTYITRGSLGYSCTGWVQSSLQFFSEKAFFLNIPHKVPMSCGGRNLAFAIYIKF